MEPVPFTVGNCPILDDLVAAMTNNTQTTQAEMPNAPTGAAAAPGDPSQQWLDSKMGMRTELRYDTRADDGKSVVVIEDRVRNKFFQVGATEYKLIAALDGNRTTRDVVNDLACPLITEEFAAQVCQWLVQSNLVHCSTMDNAKRLGQQAESLRKSKLIGLANPISMKVNLFNPNNLFSAIEPFTRFFFTKSFLVVWCILGLIAIRTMYLHWEEMGTASTGILSGNGWIWLMAFWLILKVIHETAHGVACRRYGGEVPEAGILFLLFTPMAFVNVTSMWRFPNRWHRIVVAAAGMYIELFISFVALIVWAKTDGLIANVAFNTFIMASLTTILFNANPLMRFDGYFILADSLGVTNLYTKGTKWFGDRIKSAFFGIPRTKNICPKNELTRVAIYGSMAFFWKISISISLIIGASVLFKGAGVALGVIGVAMFFGMPMYQQYKQTLGEKAHPIDRKRTAFSCALVACFALSMFTILRAPATQSAPAIVQFAEETVVRAAANGFLDELFVASGDKVIKGQLLARLKNDELINEVTELEQKAVESQIQIRIHNQIEEELALARAEEENLVGLLKQLEEKREQAEGLEVRAPFDGFVFQRGLENSKGNFLSRGDPLMNMAQKQTKEIIVSIDQRDLESLKGNEGQNVRVAIPGLNVFRSKLRSIDKRASTKPSHPSLCAQAGGPLPVMPTAGENGESEVELLTPRFSAALEIDSEVSSRLFSGQRGRAFFSTERKSLGSYLFLAASDWLEKKIDIATQTTPF